jgi:tRNA-splicing ligase RtcB
MKERIKNFKIEIPPRDGMNVPVVIYTTNKLISFLFKDRAIEQLINVAKLPGIKKYALGMPDIHEGYGFPIGGVAAFDAENGVVSPGGVGFDVNCGVRVIKTNLTTKDIKDKLRKVGEVIFDYVPAGVGSVSRHKFTSNEIKNVLRSGIYWALNKGFAFQSDIDSCEDNGKMQSADPSAVSEKAIKRGRDELGTLGAGNHFLEIDKIDKIYDAEIASRFGLFKGQIVVWIHTGSRGFGHQVATDYISLMKTKMEKYHMELLDRDLVSIPLIAPESELYLRAMASAANFAWVNRQVITHFVRLAFSSVFRVSAEKLGMFLLYDVAHNIAKFEKYKVGGKEELLLVHRKGATRAFPAGHKALGEKYRDTGQPVLLPGDMKNGSFILVGLKNSLNETFGSVAHGSGRVMSRHKALKEISLEKVYNEMERNDIVLLSNSRRIIREEAPEAYKDVNEVVKPIIENSLAALVARSKPLLVVKG